MTRVLAGLAVFVTGVCIAFIATQGRRVDPERAFLPHLAVLLLAAPLGALAAGLATGGVRHLRSGER